MTYVLALLFAISFLPQGLFYRHEYLPAVALLGLWLLWRAARRGGQVPWRVYLGPLLMVLGYVISLFDALRPADTLMAIAELVVLLGLMAAAAGEEDPRAGLRGIVAAALLAALYAFLVYGAFLHDPAAYTPPFLTGSIQYHNAFGAAMALGLMVALGLAADEQRTLGQPIYAAAAVPLALGLYLSLSRGVYVLFPFAVIVLILALAAAPRRRIVAVAIPGLLVGALLIRPFTAAADHHAPVMFVELAVAMLAAGAIALLLLRTPIALLGRRALQVYGAIVVVAGVLVGFLAKARLAHLIVAILPGGVGARVTAISLQSGTLLDRVVMDGIALRIIAGHPWLGFGANAWQDLYHRYQTSYFIANETHDYLTQLLIEGGILAGIGLLWLLYLLLRRLAGRSRTQGQEALRVGAAAAGLFLLLHSLMDFDLSYFSFLAMFFYLVGVATGSVVGGEREQRWTLPLRPLLYPLAAIALILLLPLGVGEKFYTDGMQLLARGRFTLALQDLRQAATFDPLDGRIPLAEGQIMAEQAPAKAMKQLARAETLLPDDANVLEAVMQTATTSQEYGLGAKAAATALSLEPRRADTYWYGAQILPEAALHALAKGQGQQGKRDLTVLSGLVGRYRDVGQAALFVDLQTVPLPANLPMVMDGAAGEWDALTGHLRAAEPLLWAAHQDPALRPHVDLWLYGVASRLQDQHYVDLLKGQPWVLWRNMNKDYLDLEEILAASRK